MDTMRIIQIEFPTKKENKSVQLLGTKQTAAISFHNHITYKEVSNRHGVGIRMLCHIYV